MPTCRMHKALTANYDFLYDALHVFFFIVGGPFLACLLAVSFPGLRYQSGWGVTPPVPHWAYHHYFIPLHLGGGCAFFSGAVALVHSLGVSIIIYYFNHSFVIISYFIKNLSQ